MGERDWNCTAVTASPWEDCWSQQEGTGPGGLLASSIPQGDLRPYYTLGRLSDLGSYKALDSEKSRKEPGQT